MIRVERLAVSRPTYAFNPQTWRCNEHGQWFVDAVWFKRKSGVLTATMGTYHPFIQPFRDQPTDGRYESWIAAANDNRYGGTHLASWDGDTLLCSDPRVRTEVALARIPFLGAMLNGFPNVPAGFDGWWTFPKGGGR